MSREKQQVSIEITDQEIRVLGYLPTRERRLKRLKRLKRLEEFKEIDMTSVMFETFILPSGVIEQGIVRQPTELTRILELSLKNRGIKGNVSARITIPLSNGFVREYSLPWISKRERKQLIPYLADEEIPIPTEERVYDYWIAEEKLEDKRIRVVLSGIRKANLTSFTTCFEAAGLGIESLGFSPLAWAYALNLEPNQHILLIKEHSDFFQFHLYKGRIPEMTRTLRLDPQGSLGIEERDVELERVLAYFWTFQEKVDIRRVIISEGKESAKLGQKVCAYLRQEKGLAPQLQTMTEVISPYINSEFKGDEPEKILAVLGMAFQSSSDYPNNFWREKVRIKQGQRRRWIATVLLLVLSFTGLVVRDLLVQKVDTLDSEISQLEANREVMTRSIDEETKRTQEWLQLVEHPTSVGHELAQVQSLMGNGIQFKRLDYQEGTLIIEGDATQPALVQNLFEKLQLLGWDQPRLGTYHQDENRDSTDERIEFSLTTKKNS